VRTTTPPLTSASGDMEMTFEEIVSANLDEIYQGALVLSAGSAEDAEELVVDAVARAASAFRRTRPGNPESFLEDQLVMAVVGRAEADGGVKGKRGKSRAGHDLDRLTALSILPPTVRSALWLVVIRRRPYSKVASLLGVDREQVSRWVIEGHRGLYGAGVWRQWKQENG